MTPQFLVYTTFLCLHPSEGGEGQRVISLTQYFILARVISKPIH